MGDFGKARAIGEVAHSAFVSIVDALAEAVTIRGAGGHIVYANRAALDRLGFASVEELRHADPRALMGDYETTNEQGYEVAMEDLPSMRVLRDEEPEPLLVRHLNRHTGEERWALLKAAALRDAGGAVEAAVTIIEDVTAAKRSALRTEFLARASQVLASSLDYQVTLRNVAGLAVPQIADWCAVDLFDDAGGREPVAVAHTDPAKVHLAERLREFEPEELDPEQGLGRVRRTGEPLLYAEIPDELLVQAAVDAEQLTLLRAVGMRSALIAPMKGRGRTIGALTLVSAESGRTFNESDVEFAGQIAERAVLAVENARLYTERADVARTLQRSLLPEAVPEVPGWEISTLYLSAEPGNEVGGDFYDFWNVAGDWLMMIGDVTGKGVAAAALTSLVRHTAMTASDFDRRPAEILARVDAALKRSASRAVCSALCLHLRQGGGTIAAGGHPLALCVTAAGVHELGRPGTLLGAFDEVRWPETQFMLEVGDTLVVFTDGVTDAVGADGERFGIGRLRELLASASDQAPIAMRDRLVEALADFQVGAPADDTAVAFMRFIGSEPAAGAGLVTQGVGFAQPGNSAS
jgi:PAS domain S-box-containing protein